MKYCYASLFVIMIAVTGCARVGNITPDAKPATAPPVPTTATAAPAVSTASESTAEAETISATSTARADRATAKAKDRKAKSEARSTKTAASRNVRVIAGAMTLWQSDSTGEGVIPVGDAPQGTICNKLEVSRPMDSGITQDMEFFDCGKIAGWSWTWESETKPNSSP